MAAAAYKKDNDETNFRRCKLEASAALADHAESFLNQTAGAVVAASWFSDAIVELHGVNNVKDIRNKIKKRLIEVQSDIPESLQRTTTKIDWTEPSLSNVAHFSGLSGV